MFHSLDKLDTGFHQLLYTWCNCQTVFRMFYISFFLLQFRKCFLFYKFMCICMCMWCICVCVCAHGVMCVGGEHFYEYRHSCTYAKVKTMAGVSHCLPSCLKQNLHIVHCCVSHMSPYRHSYKVLPMWLFMTFEIQTKIVLLVELNVLHTVSHLYTPIVCSVLHVTYTFWLVVRI